MGEKEEQDAASDIPRERNEPRPDFSKPPPPKPLPKELQDTLNSDEKLWSTLYEGRGQDSTSSDVRYAAYAARVRTILISAQRYVAYTSDIGESFRPVAHPHLVRTAYAVSWAYLIGDTAHEGYKAYVRNQKLLHPEARTPGAVPAAEQDDATHNASNGTASPAKDQSKSELASDLAAVSLAATKDLVKPPPGRVPPLDDYRTVMVQRAIFQSIASMGLPAFTIHSVVRYSGRAFKNVANKTVRTWGPIGLGLAAVPFLPFMFDKPVEHAVEWTFHKGFELVGGKEAVGEVTQEKKEL